MNAKELHDWFAGPSPISEMDAEDKHTILRALSLLAAIEDASGPTPETKAARRECERIGTCLPAYDCSTRLERERNAALRALDQAKEE